MNKPNGDSNPESQNGEQNNILQIEENTGKLQNQVSVLLLPGLTKYSLEINEKSDFFEGHFPGNPVLPGVISLDYMKELGLQYISSIIKNKEYKFSGASKVSFQNVIKPGEVLDISIKKYEKVGENIIIELETKVGDKITSTAILQFSQNLENCDENTNNPKFIEANKTLNKEEVKLKIPHREPFLFLDSVELSSSCALGKLQIFKKMPNNLIIEALAQVGAVYVLDKEENTGKQIYFANLKNVKFYSGANIGDEIELFVEMTKMGKISGEGKGIAYINGKTILECEMKFAIPK